jgi:hypothetical protein
MSAVRGEVRHSSSSHMDECAGERAICVKCIIHVQVQIDHPPASAAGNNKYDNNLLQLACGGHHHKQLTYNG